MSTPITLFVPGPWENEAALKIAFAYVGVDAEFEWIPADGRFGEAFAQATLGARRDLLLASIDRCPGAAIVYPPVTLPHDATALAGLARKLEAAGGLAVRVEQSARAHAWEAWRALLDGGSPWSLFSAFVVLVSDGDAIRSCGMHVFDRPDVQVPAERDPDAAARLVELFATYVLAEDPILATGHTFSADAASPRRRLERWPDAQHPSDHPFHNPFGLWRLGAAGTRADDVPELALTIVPSLAAVLMARERELGRPLGRDEVESIVGNAPCIAMPRDVARKVERERGYVDLEPTLAWAQWQVVRATHGG